MDGCRLQITGCLALIPTARVECLIRVMIIRGWGKAVGEGGGWCIVVLG